MREKVSFKKCACIRGFTNISKTIFPKLLFNITFSLSLFTLFFFFFLFFFPWAKYYLPCSLVVPKKLNFKQCFKIYFSEYWCISVTGKFFFSIKTVKASLNQEHIIVPTLRIKLWYQSPLKKLFPAQKKRRLLHGFCLLLTLHSLHIIRMKRQKSGSMSHS